MIFHKCARLEFGLGARTKLVIMERDESSPRNGYTAKSHIDALNEGLVEHYTPGTICQQGNTQIHKAEITKEWFETHGVEVMD